MVADAGAAVISFLIGLLAGYLLAKWLIRRRRRRNALLIPPARPGVR